MTASHHAARRRSLLHRLSVLNIEIMQATMSGDHAARARLAWERSQIATELERGFFARSCAA